MKKKFDAGLVWFRRDLRAHDHAALYHALRSCRQVWCVFVFDQEILDALGMVEEGVPNTLSVYEISRKLGVRTPLIDAVYSVLFESKPPMEALVELMTRDPRPELD